MERGQRRERERERERETESQRESESGQEEGSGGFPIKTVVGLSLLFAGAAGYAAWYYMNQSPSTTSPEPAGASLADPSQAYQSYPGYQPGGHPAGYAQDYSQAYAAQGAWPQAGYPPAAYPAA